MNQHLNNFYGQLGVRQSINCQGGGVLQLKLLTASSKMMVTGDGKAENAMRSQLASACPCCQLHVALFASNPYGGERRSELSNARLFLKLIEQLSLIITACQERDYKELLTQMDYIFTDKELP